MVDGERPPTDPGDLGPDDESATHADGTESLTPGAQPVSPATPPDVHALPTQQLARKSPDSHATRYSTASSPVEAMRLEEIERTQIFLKVAMITAVAG